MADRGEETTGEIILKNIEEHRCATMGIALKNAKYNDLGIGTRDERLAVDYVFRVLDIPTLFADSIQTSTRSRHVLEKAGFAFLREDKDFKYCRIDRDSGREMAILCPKTQTGRENIVFIRRKAIWT